jgi:hypothetical protein
MTESYHLKIYEINIFNNKILSLAVVVILLIIGYTIGAIEFLYVAFMLSPRYRKLLCIIGLKFYYKIVMNIIIISYYLSCLNQAVIIRTTTLVV